MSRYATGLCLGLLILAALFTGCSRNEAAPVAETADQADCRRIAMLDDDNRVDAIDQGVRIRVGFLSELGERSCEQQFSHVPVVILRHLDRAVGIMMILVIPIAISVHTVISPATRMKKFSRACFLPTTSVPALMVIALAYRPSHQK